MYTIQNYFVTEDNTIIQDIYDFECNPRSVVSLELFFNDPTCIISTVCKSNSKSDSPTLIFYELLKSIRDREEVEAVLVEISGIEIREIGGKFMHPSTERIYIVTSAGQKEVSSWVEPLKPDVISEGWLDDLTPDSAPEISEGNEVFALYWGYYPEHFS